MSISMQNEINALKERCERLEYHRGTALEGYTKLTLSLAEVFVLLEQAPPDLPSTKRVKFNTTKPTVNGMHPDK